MLKSITSGLDPPVRPPLCNELWRRNRGDAHCSVGVRARAGYSPALQRCPVAHFILQRTVGEAAPRSSLRQIMHVGERVGPASAVVRLEWLTWLHSPQRLGAAWRLGQRNSKLFAPSCSCLCGDFSYKRTTDSTQDRGHGAAHVVALVPRPGPGSCAQPEGSGAWK